MKNYIILFLILSACEVKAQSPKYPPENPIVIDTILFDRIVPGAGMTMKLYGNDRYLERWDSKTEIFWDRFIDIYEEYLNQNPTGTPTGFIPYMKKRSIRELREQLKNIK